MFDKEKMFKSKTAIRLNEKEYDELKQWCNNNNIYICGYFAKYPHRVFCLNFLNSVTCLRGNADFFRRENYDILSLDDIRIKHEIEFDEICLSSEYVVNCDTEEKANNYLKWLEKKGYLWGEGCALSEKNYFEIHNEETTYEINNRHIFYAYKKYFLSVGKKILKYDDIVIDKSKGDNKMKYKLLKTLTAEFVKEYSPCEDEFNKFVRKYGFTEKIEWTKETEDYMLKQNGWIEFLLNTNFIDKNIMKYDEDYFYIIKDHGNIFKLSAFNSSLKHNAYTENENFAFISVIDNDYYVATYTDPQDLLNYLSQGNNIIEFKTKKEYIEYLKENL